ncbi:hypothetical protein PENSPDRAFT_17344 [Peniophora sp. CONT]|nr:hypothetical protein PENSPDRAFT_17344 [Peniophora sp. CONT]
MRAIPPQTDLRYLPASLGEVINFILGWFHSTAEDMPHTILLAGHPDTGKSSIARSIAHFAKDMSRLGAFVFIDRDSPDNSDIRWLIPAIASGLADSFPSFRHALAKSLNGISHVSALALKDQFRILIHTPLAGMGSIGPLAIVIDALDGYVASADRLELFQVLSEGLPMLPENFRVILTSRPDDDVRELFSPSRHVLRLSLEASDGKIVPDLIAFISDQLDRVNGGDMVLFDDKHYQALAARAARAAEEDTFRCWT